MEAQIEFDRRTAGALARGLQWVLLLCAPREQNAQ